MVNEALLKMDGLFAEMYEADIVGGCLSIAPEKLMRAMLLEIFCNARSESQLMEHTNSWFPGIPRG